MVGLLFEMAQRRRDTSGTVLDRERRQLGRRGSFVTISRQTAVNTHSLIYRKFKLPLDHWRLTDPKALAEFSRTARRAADITGVALAEPGSSKHTRDRSVIFYDTDEFDLYRNNFILRKRTPVGRARSARQELVFKFRHPDRHTTVSVDPKPIAEIPHTIRFKEQVLPALHNKAGIRSIFWHGCKIFERCELENLPYGTLAKVFPVLRHFGVDPNACMKAFNGLIVDESLLEIGTLNFVEGVTAKALISLWRVEPGQRALTSEFSFQIKFDPARSSIGQIRGLSESFYLELQSRLAGWTAAGSTKVHEVYHPGQTAEPTRAQ